MAISAGGCLSDLLVRNGSISFLPAYISDHMRDCIMQTHHGGHTFPLKILIAIFPRTEELTIIHLDTKDHC